MESKKYCFHVDDEKILHQWTVNTSCQATLQFNQKQFPLIKLIHFRPLQASQVEKIRKSKKKKLLIEEKI